MLKKIRIKNYKNLRDTGDIELDPINMMEQITPSRTRITEGLVDERLAKKINPDLARKDSSIQRYLETLGCKCQGFKFLATLNDS